MEKSKINFNNENKIELAHFLSQNSGYITFSEMMETNFRQYVFVFKSNEQEEKLVINVNKEYYNSPELNQIDLYVKGHNKVKTKITKISKNNSLSISKAASLTIAGIVLVTTVVAMRGINNINNSIASDKTLTPFNKIVSDNTYRADDQKYYWYDTAAIANEIRHYKDDKDAFNMAVYATYNKINYNRAEMMNEIINILGYDSFEDYFKKLGFKTVEEYNDAMYETSTTKYMNSYIDNYIDNNDNSKQK